MNGSVVGSPGPFYIQRAQRVLAMAELNVVALPIKNLNDIPERLRDMATRIESGELNADTLFVVIPQDGDYPSLYGWGDIERHNDPIIQLNLCLHNVCGSINRRSS